MSCQDFVFWNIYCQDNVMSAGKGVIRENVHSEFCPVRICCLEKVMSGKWMSGIGLTTELKQGFSTD
ncbi:unnamed protein product [Rhizophagus irregularis]|nr:unnamed protein product [Rhizophagus irregularis]